MKKHRSSQFLAICTAAVLALSVPAWASQVSITPLDTGNTTSSQSQSGASEPSTAQNTSGQTVDISSITKPTVASQGAVLLNAADGSVLFSKNGDTTYYPASITKLMTALLVAENCNLDDTVTFSATATTNLESGAVSIGMAEGDTMTVRQCLYALLLKSANEVGNALYKNGYRMKIFNTINFSKSMHYNPFAYLHSEKDILKLVTTLIANTKGESKGGDDFWLKAETLLYTALIGYIHYEAPEEEQNFSTLLEMINAMEVREDDEEFKNPVDMMFDELAEQNPDHFAVRQYAKYKLAAGKTAKSILVSCGARLAPFDIKELRDLTAYDELELDTLGDEKTALFLIMSDTDGTFNFLISMIYTQMFNLLCEKADDVYGGRLPVHVRCLIDEAANIGQIPNLEKLVATIRSREISACLVLQAKSQLKAIYKDNADTIIGNMDSQIFLGGTEQTTLKDLNAILGKETIDMYNTGQSKGSQESYNMNYQKLGKDMTYLFVKSSVALNFTRTGTRSTGF